MTLTRSKIFLFCCLAFIAGVGLASFLPGKIMRYDLWWFGMIMVCLVFTILFWRIKSKDVGKNKEIRPRVPEVGPPYFLIFLFLLFFFLGIWRFSIGLPGITSDKIWYYNGQTVTVAGVVSNEPDKRQKNQKLEIASRKIKIINGVDKKKQPSCEASQLGCFFFRPISGKILVSTNLYPEFSYGDEVVFTCQLEAPEAFRGFQYDRYLARFDIYSVCYYPAFAPSTWLMATAGKSRIAPTSIGFAQDKPSSSLTSGAAGEGSYEAGAGGRRQFNRSPLRHFYKIIFKIKDRLREKINRGLAEPAASLGRAIVLGDKKGISPEMRENFSRAGLSHIVAISGMHISILSAMVMSLLLGIGFRRRYAFYGATIFLISYITLIGLPASAMRAGLMGFLVLWALNLGRLNKLTNSLVLAAGIMLLINPRLIRDDIGFQLSFLAVLGIAYAYPIFERLLERCRTPKGVSDTVIKTAGSIFGITIAAQIFTLPVIAINFGTISIIAPLANLLVLWTLPILMAVILVGLILSFMAPGLSVLFFLPAGLILYYLDFVARIIVKVPYSYIEVDYIWIGWGIMYYLLLGIFIIRAKRKTRDLV